MLLIIATITVSTLSGNNGIVEQTVTAKEESEIKSELKVVDLASNQAKNKNKYGDVTGEELVKALKNNAGEDQTEVEYYEKGSLYFVTFKKSNRVYEVTTAGYAKYVGKPEDAVVLFGKPKSSIAPKTSVEVNVIIKTLQENKIDRLEYVWNKSEDKQPSKEEFSNNTPKVLENVENEKTEKQTIVSLPEGTPEGEYYLWVKVTNNGEETIEHLGPYIIGEVSCQLAVDPNGGTWDGSSEVKVIKQSVGNKIDLKTPNPPANYEITFDADGGNVSKDKVTSVVSFNRWELKGVGTLEKNIYTFGKGKATATAQYSNEKITLPTATKEGYQIDGWYDKDGNKAGDPNEEYDPKGSEKLTAHWTPKSYELAFDYKTNGGTKGPDETQQVVYGKKVILSEIKAEKDGGWNFIGWNKKASDKTALDEITMGAQNEKVYALFKKDIKLTFKDKNGDKYSNPNPVTIYNNEKGTATAPEISEYTGWEPLYWTKETKADGAKSVGAKTGDNTISNITDPATYYARYKKDIKIEFDLNGGTGKKPDDIPGVVQVSTSDITKPKAATIDMPEIASGNEPKKAGYVFNGWNTAQDGNGTHYDIEGTGSFVDNTTLYAEWTEKKATKITLNKETATISYDDTTTIIATLEPADLVNKNVNWTTSDANICNISKATSVSGEEITLTAKKVGKATITATAADGSGKTATCVVTVVAKKITVPTAKTNLVYNAANQTGVEQTTEYNVTDGTKIDAGSYTAKVVLKDKTNTMWNDETTTDKTVDWSIAKKDITVEWKEQTSWVYDGTAHKPEVTTPINGAGQEKINLIVEGEKVNVGTDYTATAKISSVDGGQKDKDNYNLTDYTKKFSIREAVIIGKVTINGTNTYGETLTAEVSELDPSDATLKYQWFSNNTNSTTGGTKLTEPQDSKTYTIGKGLVGKYIYVVVTATKPNFNSATFNDITDKEKNTTEKVSAKKVKAPTAKTGLVYNGQEQIGVEDGSGYTVKDGTKKDAGNYTAKVELDEKENTIWNDGTTDDKSMPWSIAKKAITVKADNKTRKYGEENPTLTATVGETGVQGEKGKITGTPTTTAEKMSKVGNYPITRGGNLALADNDTFKANNYEIEFKDGTLTITKIDNTLNVTAKTLTYNTQEQELVNQTGLQGDIYYSTDVELTKDNYLKEGTKNTIPKGTNAGNYKAYYYAPGNENYNAKSDSVDVTIAQYSLKDAIIETVGSQIFTGSAITPKPEVKVNIPSEKNKTTLVEGRDFEYSYKDNTAVGTATITITGKGNYKDSKPITFNIENKKQIKVSKTDYTGKYDGKSHTFTFNVTEPTSGYNVYYKVGTTSLNENNYTDGTTEEKPTRKDAGTTIVQWYIHTTNAQYADTNGSIEITINPKSIDVTADNKTKKYGEENPTLTATAGETGITGETAKIAGALKTTATKTSNVGTYVIGNDNVELKDNGTFKASNYEMNFINGTLTITKADNTLKVNAKTLTYNTTAQELVNEEGKQGDVYYSIGTELTSDNYNIAGRTTIPTGTNAGDYKVYYYTPGNDNYGPSKGTVDVTIEKYDLKNANMTQGALDYTGSKLTPKPEVTVNIPSEQNKTKLTAGTEFTYSYGANTNAGTNAGSVTITAKDNTNYTGSKTVNFNINKIANTLDVKARTLTYNTQAQELVTESKKHGDVYYSLETKLTKDNCDEKGSKNVIPKETNAGTYKVYYYTPGDTNYNEKDGFVDVTIEKYSLNNAEIDSVNAQIYTGSAVTPKPEVKVNIPSEQNKTKLVEGTDFDYSYSNNNGVGTAKVTVTGKGKGNYKDSKSITFTLADKKPIKATPSNYSGTYNGEAHTFELNVTEPAGCKIYYKEGTETLTNSNYTKGTTEEKPTRTDAGTTTVQWYIHSTNAEYSDINGYSTITINPKTITVTADNKSRVYGAANPELTYTHSGVVSGQTAGFTGALDTEAKATSNVGSYDITQGTLALKDNGTFKAANYKITYTKGTLTITKQTVNPPTNVTISADGKVTWTNSNNATGYEISTKDDFSENKTTATNGATGVNYLNAITAGSRTVYVRAVNSDTDNYKSPSTSATATATVISATFYYYNGSKVTSKTNNAITGSNGNASITIPTEVTESSGSYETDYAGLSASTGNMTQVVAPSESTVSINKNTTYYAIYRTNVTIYRPSSLTETVIQKYYRNQWLTSTSAISNPILSKSTTGTENQNPTVVSGFSFYRLYPQVNNGGTAITVENAAKTTVTTYYAREKKNVTATFYYYDGSAQSSATGSAYQYLGCTSTTGAAVTNSKITVPDVVSESKGPKEEAYGGVASTTGSSTALTAANINTGRTSYYAFYKGDGAGETITATFYYNSNSTNGEFTAASKTATGTQVYNYTSTTDGTKYTSTKNSTTSNGKITIPTEVTGSKGKYNSKYVGVATEKNTMSSSTSATTEHTKYYAVYSSGVTIYYPSSTTARGKYSYFRNEYLTADDGSSIETKLATTNTGKSDISFTSSVSGYGLYGFATSAGSNKRTYSNVAGLRDSNTTTAYAILYKSITGTFNYHSGTAATSTTANANQYVRCTSSAAEISNSNYTIPTVVSTNRTINSVVYTYRGVSTSKEADATVATPTTANTTFYASYTYPVSIIYNANGGTGTMANTTANAFMNYSGTKVGGSITPAACTFTYSGHSCYVWNTAANGSGTSYPVGKAITRTENLSVYAQWIVNNYQNTNTSIYYETLASALSEVANGQTIKALKGITETTAPNLASGKTNVTIDLNGKTTTLNGVTLTNAGTLTITGAGTFTTSSNVDLLTNSGTLTLNHTGTISSTSSGAYHVVKNTGTLNVTGTGTVTSSAKSYTIKGGDINISNGLIKTTADSAIGTAGTFNMTGGKIRCEYSTGVAIYGNGTATVSGGIIEKDKTPAGTWALGACFIISESASATLSGGTLKIYNGNGSNVIYNDGSGTLTVCGATIQNLGNSKAGNNTSSGKIVVTSGTITSNGAHVLEAYSDSTGAIEISGGQLSTNGGDSSYVINNTGTSSTVKVTGGTLKASGATAIYSTSTGTVTIGESGSTSTTSPSITGGILGDATNVGDIIVHSGKITATTLEAIRSKGNITINGGDISSTSSYAAITDGASTLLKITGGTIASSWDHTVTTTDVVGGTIQITGGTITNTNANTTGRARAVNNKMGTTTITGGTIASTNGEGVYFTTGTVTIGTSGSTSTTSPSITGRILGEATTAGNIVVHSGKITGTSTEAIRSNGNITINGGDISATKSYAAITDGASTLLKITGGMIVSSGDLTVTTTNVAGGNIQITGGTITNTKTSGVARAVNNYKGTTTITGGTIVSNTGEGVYATTGTVTLGQNEETPSVSTTVPSITGGTYGVQVTEGRFNFYDGKITGPINNSMSKYPNEIPVGYGLDITKSGSTETATLHEANYQVSSPYLATTTIESALSVADEGATIKVLRSLTDFTRANVTKNVTLDLNGNTLTRRHCIEVSSGDFTLLGKDSNTNTQNGVLYCTDDDLGYDGEDYAVAGIGIWNSSGSATITIDNGAYMKCADTAIHYKDVGLTSDQYTRNLYIKNSWVHTFKEKNALNISNSHAITIDNSYVYMPYASTYLINVSGKLDWMTVTGKSRIGGGNIQTSDPHSLIYYDNTYTGTLNIQMLQNAILMGGSYTRSTICTARKFILSFLDESEIYNNYNNSSATCIRMEGNSSNSQIDVNTKGWLYSYGSNVINSNNDFTFNYTNGSFAQKGQYVDNKNKVKATTSRNRYFYIMNGYNSIGGKQATNMYFRGSGWVKDGETDVYSWKYFNSDGTEYTGLYHSDHYYYLENSNLYLGWKQVGSDWYYFQGDIPNNLSVSDPIYGSALEGGPYILDGEKFIFGSDGKMLTGWQKAGNYWYYLNTDTGDNRGKAIKGWFNDTSRGKLYYLEQFGDDFGIMITGWREIEGYKYYFDGSGAMVTGWLKIGDYWYYFDSNGHMLANTSRNINGKTYNFDADGHCTNP